MRVLRVLNACQTSLTRSGRPVALEVESEPPAWFAHKTAVVDEGCDIGADSRIWHFSHVMSGAKIGKRCNLGQNVLISSGARLGDNVKVQNNVSLYDGVTLENDVFCGPSMVFTNVINPRSHISRKSEFLKTLVKKGATIGANATVVCGHEIGRYAFVGAGAVVTRDVPDFALVTGNPSRITGWMCECGHHLAFVQSRSQCRFCGKAYEKNKETVRRILAPETMEEED